MATSHSYEKKWKYVSIGLMAVLAVGFSFPQAFAHITSDMKHGVEHVIALLNAIKAKTDNLPSDPASQSAVEKAIPTQVVTAFVASNEEISDTVTCTSSSDFIVHVSASRGAPPEGGFIQVSVTDLLSGHIYHIPDSNTLTFGADAGDSVTIDAGGSSGFVFAAVTMQTAEGATASCIQS
jgi:hypothetical protein